MSDVVIAAVGSAGDGVVTDAGAVDRFVPFALPGERWLSEGGGRFTRLSDSPDRVATRCRHFDHCGGCALQHWADAPYRAWKRSRVAQALRRAGYAEDALGPLVACPPGARRRIAFSIRQGRKGRVGFVTRRGREIVNLNECPVAHPALAALPAALRSLPTMGATRARALRTDTGVDLLLTLDRTPDAGARMDLAAFAETHDLARLSLDLGDDAPELLAERRQPILAHGGATVTPPPGAFAQATQDGEAAIAAIVAKGVAGAARVADLFCGVGAIGLRLAAQAQVVGFDADAAAVTAGDAAARAAGLRYSANARDLFRKPLAEPELKRFDAVVFDPPRAGAKAQAAALAADGPATIVAVSCDPGTLARDLRILRDGGYGLTTALAIDQFLWSPHVESVCVLKRS